MAPFVAAVRGEMAPLKKNYFRSGETLQTSLETLDAIWAQLSEELGGEGLARLRNREVASVVAAARFSLTAALARTESRAACTGAQTIPRKPKARCVATR